jgi:hypothetical protein
LFHESHPARRSGSKLDIREACQVSFISTRGLRINHLEILNNENIGKPEAENGNASCEKGVRCGEAGEDSEADFHSLVETPETARIKAVPPAGFYGLEFGGRKAILPYVF